MNKPIYNRIKAALAEQGKTSLWLSKTIGKNPNTVSKWCRNDMQPRIENLYQVARALNIDVRELLVSTK
jgi:transcriptional regulator with XRE-family HTH domain